MSVGTRKGSPVWNYDFWLNKVRYQGPTPIAAPRPGESPTARRPLAKNWETAEIVRLRQAPGGVPSPSVPGTHAIAVIFADYKASLDNGSHADAVGGNLDLIEQYCGSRKPTITTMDKLTDEVLIGLIKWRRAQHKWDREDQPLVGDISVNAMTKTLQRVFNWTKEIKKLRFLSEPIWKLHKRKIPKRTPREMTAAEDQALVDVFDADYDRWRRFTLRSGLRLKETLIRWSEVDFDTREIVKTGKFNKEIRKQLTPEAFAILKECHGDHPVWVFTSVAERTVRAHTAKGAKREPRVEGKRYPLTRAGLKSYWKRRKHEAAKACPSLEGTRPLTIHKMRHTFATRMLRETGNIVAVQLALGHADVSTTANMYAGMDTKQVRDAMETTELKYPDAKPRPRLVKGAVVPTR